MCFSNVVGRHIEFNLEDAEVYHNQRHIDMNCQVVGNGGCSKKVSSSSFSSCDIGGPALTSDSPAGAAGAVRGGQGIPAESTRVGKGRGFEAVKGGGRVGLIGGDGRDTLRSGILTLTV